LIPGKSSNLERLRLQEGIRVKKVIMVVDDESEVREYVATALKESGYLPVTVGNGKDAMDMIVQKRPDLVILDVLMPGQGGIKMYRELRSSGAFKNIPVIIYSGIAKRTFLRTQSGRTDLDGRIVPEPEAYIEKPANPQYLAKVVREVLDGSN